MKSLFFNHITSYAQSKESRNTWTEICKIYALAKGSRQQNHFFPITKLLFPHYKTYFHRLQNFAYMLIKLFSWHENILSRHESILSSFENILSCLESIFSCHENSFIVWEEKFCGGGKEEISRLLSFRKEIIGDRQTRFSLCNILSYKG